MRTLIVITGLALVLGSGAARGQAQSETPTEVGKLGFYTCPAHPQIQATWPTRCPGCRHVLQEAQPSAMTALGAVILADRDDRNRERREREERAERGYYDNRYYGYGPYNFPYGSGDYAGRPYYNPSYGYYNPNTGYYFNPNTGYYYNPNTRQGYYAQNYNPNRYSYPYYGPNYAPYGYRYPNEEARERERREGEEREERERRDRD